MLKHVNEFILHCDPPVYMTFCMFPARGPLKLASWLSRVMPAHVTLRLSGWSGRKDCQGLPGFLNQTELFIPIYLALRWEQWGKRKKKKKSQVEIMKDKPALTAISGTFSISKWHILLLDVSQNVVFKRERGKKKPHKSVRWKHTTLWYVQELPRLSDYLKF